MTKTINDELFDIEVGRRIRNRRKSLGLTQSELGKLLGVTFQQVQKYENGRNGINLKRLIQLSRALCTHPEFFYSK